MTRRFLRLYFLWVNYFRRFSDSLVAVFYPQECELCAASVEDTASGAICENCWAKTAVFTGSEPLCAKCGRVFSGGNKSFAGEIRCHHCDEQFFDSARATGVYEGALRRAVIKLKIQPVLSEKIKDLFAQSFKQSPINSATKIIPVPLHPKRLRERGFNQAAVLAEILAVRTGLPVLENSLERNLYTAKHRAGMDERARRESVEKSFVVKNSRLIKNEKILLVDDVFTTGATVSTCARVLKENGASEVFVLTLARAV